MKISNNEINPERNLLDIWHPHIANAMKQLHTKFLTDTKFILTESDLKCWLFYYLQQEKPYIPFAVHTEVTHYAPHLVEKADGTDIIKLRKKYKFRDLSIFKKGEIKDAEEIWSANIDDFVHPKGFKYTGSAIHFELKMVRQSNNRNQVQGLKTDIQKLINYKGNSNQHIRDFIIVCGSRCENTTLAHFVKAIENKVGNSPKAIFIDRVRFYLFDREQMISLKVGDNGKVEYLLKSNK